MLRRPAGRRGAAVAVAAALLVVAVVGTVGIMSFTGEAPRTIPATATVVQSTPCGPAGARDTVVVVVDGRSWQVPLDGCGHAVGTSLPVEVSFPDDGGAPTVQLAGTGTQPSSTLAARLRALLMAVAALAGALLTMFVWPRRSTGGWPASPG